MLAKFILICYLTICHSSSVYQFSSFFILSLPGSVLCHIFVGWILKISNLLEKTQLSEKQIFPAFFLSIHSKGITFWYINVWNGFNASTNSDVVRVLLFSVILSFQIASYTIHLLFIPHNISGFTCFILISRPESGSWTTF